MYKIIINYVLTTNGSFKGGYFKSISATEAALLRINCLLVGNNDFIKGSSTSLRGEDFSNSLSIASKLFLSVVESSDDTCTAGYRALIEDSDFFGRPSKL